MDALLPSAQVSILRMDLPPWSTAITECMAVLRPIASGGPPSCATDALTLQARLENALDEDYTLAEGYRTEGRAYSIGVRYSFE